MTTATEKKLEIRINLVKAPDSKVKAYASMRVEIEPLGTWALNHIRIVSGKNGLFVSFPSQKKGEGESVQYFDHFHPLSKEGREAANAAVLEAYEIKLASGE